MQISGGFGAFAQAAMVLPCLFLLLLPWKLKLFFFQLEE